MALVTIPRPDEVVGSATRAAGNLAHTVLYGGLADLRPMPRTLVSSGSRREVHHYRSLTVREQGDPVLLVPPLAAPARVFDLRRGCSLAEHLVVAGRPTYVVEYGDVSFRDRSLSIDPWVADVLPQAIRDVSAHAGRRGVHVVGWSLGGLFTLLAAADSPDLPIASISLLGTPVDTRLVPMVAPLRPLLATSPGGVVDRASRLMGLAPKPAVRWASQLSAFQNLVTKPVAVATHLDDTEWLAQIEAVGAVRGRMAAYPGRSYGQLYHRFVRSADLREGRAEVDGRTVELAAVTAPVAVYAGATDGIAPVAAVRGVTSLLTGSRQVDVEIVPGGHLGLLTGRGARTTTWRSLDEWFDRWGTAAGSDDAALDRPASRTPARRTAARKTAATKTTARKAPATKATAKKATAKKATTKKAPTKKATAKKATTKKATTKKSAATKKATTTKATATRSTATKAPAKRAAGGSSDARGIGSNPERRYSSRASRGLSGSGPGSSSGS